MVGSWEGTGRVQKRDDGVCGVFTVSLNIFARIFDAWGSGIELEKPGESRTPRAAHPPP